MSKNKWTKRKGYLFPDPLTGYDLVDVCLKIPDTPLYREAFLGAVYQLTKQWNWDHWQVPNTETRAATVAKYWQQLLFDHLRIGEDCMANDGCCGDDLTLSITVQQGDTYLHNLVQIFNGNPANLDPDAPTETFSSSPGDDNPTVDLRNLALCNACQQFVDGLCEAILASRGGVAQLVAAAGGGLLIIGLFFPPAEFLGLLFTGVGLALATGAEALNGLSDLILGDQNLRHGTACCMYEQLKGTAISKRAFESSLDECSEWDGSNIAPLAGAVARVMKESGTFESFLKALGIAYRQAAADLLTDCGCDSACSTFDQDDTAWEVLTGTVDMDNLITGDGTDGTVVQLTIPGGGLHKITSIAWIDSATAFNVQNVYVDCYDGVTLVSHQQLLTSFHNSMWTDISEPSSPMPPFVPVDAVDKIIIGNTFDTQDGVYTMHDITICWE